MNNIENGRITGTTLGYEGHGIFSLYLHVEFDGGGCSYGGYALDAYDKEKKQRIGTAYGHESIIAVLRVLELEKWEAIPGTFIRVEHEGLGGRIKRIGHLMKDKWLNFGRLSRTLQVLLGAFVIGAIALTMIDKGKCEAADLVFLRSWNMKQGISNYNNIPTEPRYMWWRIRENVGISSPSQGLLCAS